MLAPLEDRSIIGSPGQPPAVTEAPGDARMEIDDLRQALRESRHRLRQGAWQSTRQISQLNAEVSRLQTLCTSHQTQLERYASGVAVIELGQALMRLTENNERLKSSAHRAWLLEKTVATARSEYQKLAAERDRLAQELQQIKLNRMSGPLTRGV